MRLLALLLALATSHFFTLASFATEMTRSGVIVYDDDSSPLPSWFVWSMVVGLFAFIAWEQNQKRTKERISNREYIDDLRKRLVTAISREVELEEKLEELEPLKDLSGLYLDGYLTEQEFAERLDALMEKIDPARRSGVRAASQAEIDAHSAILRQLDQR